MSPSPAPLFQSPLLPVFLAGREGHLVGRFRAVTSWQVRREHGSGVEGTPKGLDSLLVFDDQFFSVLPFTFRQDQRIHTSPRPGNAPAWQGVPCTFGEADVWFLHLHQPTTMRFTLLFLLPERSADPEPWLPLLGSEFLRHFSLRVVLEYANFPPGEVPAVAVPVGRLEWV
jgi:hypothetical protein